LAPFIALISVYPHVHQEFEPALLARVTNSEMFLVYREAFRTATGLPMRLVTADPDGWWLDEQNVNRSPFCEALNLCKSACGACLETNRQLMKESEANNPTTCPCFAGLYATAVPVKKGTSVIGFLKIGQVFSRTPTVEQFDSIIGAIGRKTLDSTTLEILRSASLQTRSVEPERYQSMVTLLQSFAAQLSQHAESLAIIEDGKEPVAIAKARKFIHANHDRPLTLG
jgi:ligand-binding sensor protein